jgi:hypothetical protein
MSLRTSSASPLSSLLSFAPFFLVALALSGCSGTGVQIPTESLALGATVSLLLRRALTDGTWPQKWSIADPYKTALATLLGAVAAILAAKAQGTDWNGALAAGLSGLPAALQGLAEKGLPRSSESLTKLAAVAAEREKKAADSVRPPPPPPPGASPPGASPVA